MPYERRIDRRRPGCLIFLLDQSHSMMQPQIGALGRAKSEFVATTINDLLHSLVRRCTKDLGAPPRHYYDISVIGYGGRGVGPVIVGPGDGRPLLSVAEVANAVMRQDLIDGVPSPVWFDPVAVGGTPMCAAFNLAGQVAAGWAHAHRDSFPPIVINITDGLPTDGGPGEIEEWARRLRSLHTDDGGLLLFTIHLPLQSGYPVLFPSSENDVPGDDFRQMFRLSSVLPEFMRQRAGAHVVPGARGLVCNADMNTAIHALQVGTSVEYLANF